MSDTGKTLDDASALLTELNEAMRLAEMSVCNAARVVASRYHTDDPQLASLRQDVEKMLAARAAHLAHITNVYTPAMKAHFPECQRGTNDQ